MRTVIVGMTAPTVPVWAVFGHEEGEPVIWACRVHMWAQLRRVPQDIVDEEEPNERLDRVVAMVLEDDSLSVVSGGESFCTGLFLGYVEHETPDPEERKHFLERLPIVCRRWKETGETE